MRFTDNHSKAAYKKALQIAEERIQNTDPYEIDPEAMAKDVVDEVTGSFPTEYLAEYIADRMWYKRGA